MASLGRPTRRQHDSRGQLLLVTGLGLAALIVVLALVLNTVIFTENYASREVGSVDTIDALRYEHDATDAIEAALVAENAPGTTPYSTMQSNVSTETAAWSDMSARHGAVDARAVGVQLVEARNGATAVQNTSGNLTGAGGANWTLATGVTDLGDFTLTVDRTSLVANPDTTNATTLREDGVFSIVFDDSSTTIEVFLYDDGTNVIARVENSTGKLGPACPGDATTSTIDLVAGTNANNACTDLDVASAMSGTYTVEFRHGTSATGTYDIAVVGTASDASVHRVLYDATVEVRYVTVDLTYQRTVRVVGGDWP